jgi:hypothetical protein
MSKSSFLRKINKKFMLNTIPAFIFFVVFSSFSLLHASLTAAMPMNHHSGSTAAHGLQTAASCLEQCVLKDTGASLKEVLNEDDKEPILPFAAIVFLAAGVYFYLIPTARRFYFKPIKIPLYKQTAQFIF